MAKVVRVFSLYYNKAKIANAFSNELTDDPARTKFFDSEGYAGHSHGAVTGTLKIDYIIPVDGQGMLTMVEDCLAQNDVEIGIAVGGNFRSAVMAITKNNMKSDVEKGMATGGLEFEGGAPSVQAFV